MRNFEAVFGPPPKPENYRDDPLLRQKVKDRYAQLKKDFVGVKAVIDADGDVVEGPSISELSDEQVIYFAQARRAAVKLQTEVLLAVFNFTHFPVRAICSDVRMFGGSDNFPFREQRPWSLPLKEAQTPAQFDKTIASEVAQAVRRGEAFLFDDMGLFPKEVQEKNQKNLEDAKKADETPVKALPNV